LRQGGSYGQARIGHEATAIELLEELNVPYIFGAQAVTPG